MKNIILLQIKNDKLVKVQKDLFNVNFVFLCVQVYLFPKLAKLSHDSLFIIQDKTIYVASLALNH